MTLARSESEHPSAIIKGLFEERASRSDSEIISELEHFVPLPDEDSSAWSQPDVLHRGCLFVALADVSAHRRLRSAAPLLLSAACYGDPGEMMRGLRHSLEAIFNPDWAALAEVCESAANSPNKGSRLWSVSELGVLEQRTSEAVLVARLSDDEREIRHEAARSLNRLVRAHPELAQRAFAAARSASALMPNDRSLADLSETLAKLLAG